MSVKLREFIRQVRAARTAAEERAVVARECARIRTNFREGDSRHRHRDVAKVLFISMLGYPTQFAQVECLKLVASPRFSEKRVGYLGLTLLLDESSEVSMLATNSLKQDLQHTNQYISSLALSALANGASPEVCRSLLPEVEQLINCSNPFIRKKASLAAAKCVRRLGEEAAPRFLPVLPVLAADRSHGVLLGACALLFALLDAQPQLREECRQQLLQPLTKALRTCSSASYAQSAEYDIAGIVDPLLQSRLLRAVALLAEGDPTSSAAVTDLLAHVATNTDGSKNAGNCVLFECVRAIVSIDTDQGLRVLALNILGRFLSSREQNLKYVSLETLHQLLRTDTDAVTRHRDTLLDCLKDGDASIRRRALEVLIALLSPQNIQVLGRELLSFLLVCDKELKPIVASRLAMAAETHAPTRRWQFDATLKLLCLAGNYVEESAGNEMLTMVLTTPQLQSYATHKLFFCLREGSATSAVLCRVALYCVGEFGDLLVAADKSQLMSSDRGQSQKGPLDAPGAIEDPSAAALSLTAGDVVETLAGICQALLCGHTKAAPGAVAVAGAAATSASSSNSVTEALLTCLAKLTTRLPDQRDRLLQLLKGFVGSKCLEVQQRSAEFVAILESNDWPQAELAALFERMPLPQQQQQDLGKQERPVGETCFDLADLPSELSPETETADSATEKLQGTRGEAQLLELDDLLGLGATPSAPCKASTPTTAAAASMGSSSSSSGLDLLADLLGGASVSSPGANLQGPQVPTTGAAAPSTPTAATKPADPFAGLLDLSSPLATSAAVPASLVPPMLATEPLPFLLESASSSTNINTTAPLAKPAGDHTDPLAAVLNARASSGGTTPSPSAATAAAATAAAAHGDVAIVPVIDEEGLRVVFKCRRGPSGTVVGAPAYCDILAEFAADASSKPLQQFRFEAAVPKYLQLQLEPPTDSTVLPGAPPVQQRLRVSCCSVGVGAASVPASLPGGQKPLLMKCRVTFSRDGSTVQKCANVSAFPPGLLDA
ncbi:AP-1 complex subunit gamma-2 [Cyclospora cayetanensis]|uniref:AP-1 complex subunit gamma n=1 Tax=Cyclospora cayetanensis TaxID=88456 RepID=A0A6P6RZ38_9EIME|nr:AP-1 complex subunit gamma-2 [Cyclospora cayetanensis]